MTASPQEKRSYFLCTVCLFLNGKKSLSLRNREENSRTDNSKDKLREHISTVVKQAVKHLIVSGESVPELTIGVPDNNAAEEVEHEAEEYSQRSSAYHTTDALVSENARNAENAVSTNIVKNDAGNEHNGSKTPAEKTVKDTLTQLNEGEHEGNGEACLDASPDAENCNGEHRKKRDRAAPRQSENSDVAEDCSQSYHHCTLNENANFVVFHRKNLLKMKKIRDPNL